MREAEKLSRVSRASWYIYCMQKNILGIDLGKGSVGLAISRSGMFVTLLPEARFEAGKYEYAIAAIEKIMSEETVESFVIGLPLFPSGDPCEMTPIVEKFIGVLQEKFPKIPVYRQDERNSTVEAASLMHEGGKNAKKQKKNIDSAAAGVILKRYLVLIGQAD